MDTRFYDAATGVPCTFLAQKASNSVSLAIWDYAACMIAESVRRKIIDGHLQKVVAISFASFFGGGSDIVCTIFADKRSQYNLYVPISINSPGIFAVRSLKITDTHFYEAATYVPHNF